MENSLAPDNKNISPQPQEKAENIKPRVDCAQLQSHRDWSASLVTLIAPVHSTCIRRPPE